MATTSKVVPVSSDCCGADCVSTTATADDGESRTHTLTCGACSAVLNEDRQERQTVTAFLCGPGAPGRTSMRTWVTV